MYKLIITLILLSMQGIMVSCATSSYNMSPTDAGIHGVYYSYYKKGKLHSSIGINGTKADIHEVDYVKIYIPRKAKGYLIVTEDGDTYRNIKINNRRFINVPVIGLNGRKTKIIGFSLVTQNYGTSTGRLFLIGNLRVSDILKTEFSCPYKMDNGIISSCIRPSGFSFYITVFTKPSPGALKVFSRGPCIPVQDYYELKGSDIIKIKLLNAGAGICSVSIETRQGPIKKAKVININYYDSEYIPLGKPRITGKSYNYKIYAGDKIKSLSLFNKSFFQKYIFWSFLNSYAMYVLDCMAYIEKRFRVAKSINCCI